MEFLGGINSMNFDKFFWKNWSNFLYHILGKIIKYKIENRK
jgi:hypothetical protein